MNDIVHAFAPYWVSPPGSTAADLIEERGWTQQELARRLGFTTKHISLLINGNAPITEDTAVKLGARARQHHALLHGARSAVPRGSCAAGGAKIAFGQGCMTAAPANIYPVNIYP